MTEPTTPPADDLEAKLRANAAKWGPIIAQAEANAAVVRAQTSATLEQLDAQRQNLVRKADANLQVVRGLDPALADGLQGIFDDLKELRELGQPMPPMLDLDREEDPLK